jgi:hypothetical protein
MHACMHSQLFNTTIMHNMQVYFQSSWRIIVCFYAQSDRAFSIKMNDNIFVCQVATLGFKVSAAALIHESLQM